MIVIDGKDMLHLKKYDVRTVKKIYDTGEKILACKGSSISRLESGMFTTAAHALDLISAFESQTNKDRKSKLNFTVETQGNIGNAVIYLVFAYRDEGMSEKVLRENIAKKVSSYILFQMWNFFTEDDGPLIPEFDISFGMDFSTGGIVIKTQRLCLKDKSDESKNYVFDALKIGKDFAENDIHFLDNNGVGIDMPSFAQRIAAQLGNMLGEDIEQS